MAQCLHFLHFWLSLCLFANGSGSHFLIPQAPVLHRERNKPRAIHLRNNGNSIYPTPSLFQSQRLFCFFHSVFSEYISLFHQLFMLGKNQTKTDCCIHPQEKERKENYRGKLNPSVSPKAKLVSTKEWAKASCNSYNHLLL